MTAAAFTATFADWKLVKTRGVVQVVLEIPLEKSDEAYQVVGGMPDPAKERWFAIARLNQNGDRETLSREAEDERPPTSDSASRSKSWHEMPPPQQAGILCNEKSFHKFLKGYCAREWQSSLLADPNENATFCVRRLCNITSRRDLIPGTPPADTWRELVGLYRAWMREAEIV